MSECVPSEFLPAEAMKHAADRGWTYQVVDDKKNEPPMVLNLIMYEANGIEHNILYFRGKRFCEFFLNGRGVKVRNVERYK